MQDDSALSDNELAGRAQAGDRRAFELLVQRHKGPLYRLIRRHIGVADDCYDVLQDTFVSAWLALNRYDREKSFAVWLRAIALNKCRDHGRRQFVRRRFLRFTVAPPAESPDISAGDRFEASEAKRLERLDQAITALPAFYKEPLLLTAITGLSQRECAEQLNTTAKAVEMRVRRARKMLAKLLSDLNNLP